MPARICLPVIVSRAEDLPAAVARAATLADIIELRLDYLADGEIAPALALLPQLLASVARPVILTRRTREQGGQSEFANRDAPDFWRNLPLETTWRDLEAEWLANARLPFAPETALVSHHDFTGTPENLPEIYERLAQTGAGLLKIAVTARDVTDCLPAFKLLERAQSEGRRLIALAMGEAGLLTRILGPAWGSFLTFAALSEENSAAPGQLSAREMRELYRFAEITRETPVYALIGWPVRHSFSPQIHNRALAAQNLPGVYLPLAVNHLAAFMRRLARPETREFSWNLRGLSVTAPHKQAVMPFLDWLSPEAQAIGAVNTIVFGADHKLRGYNTDAQGFIAPLQELYGNLRGARCAVLGAGGAARCAAWALREAGAEVEIKARDADRAASLAHAFNAQAGVFGSSLRGFDIVVNATPCGTKGARQEETPARAPELEGIGLAYDLVYNPSQTRFLREAQAAGCRTLGGLPMFLTQAAAQFRLWTNHDAPLEVMRDALEQAIS